MESILFHIGPRIYQIEDEFEHTPSLLLPDGIVVQITALHSDPQPGIRTASVALAEEETAAEVRATFEAQAARSSLPDQSRRDTLEQRAWLRLQQAIASFHTATKRLAEIGRYSRDAKPFIETLDLFETEVPP